jgi:hypothetical protein
MAASSGVRTFSVVTYIISNTKILLWISLLLSHAHFLRTAMINPTDRLDSELMSSSGSSLPPLPSYIEKNRNDKYCSWVRRDIGLLILGVHWLNVCDFASFYTFPVLFYVYLHQLQTDAFLNLITICQKLVKDVFQKPSENLRGLSKEISVRIECFRQCNSSVSDKLSTNLEDTNERND